MVASSACRPRNGREPLAQDLLHRTVLEDRPLQLDGLAERLDAELLDQRVAAPGVPAQGLLLVAHRVRREHRGAVGGLRVGVEPDRPLRQRQCLDGVAGGERGVRGRDEGIDQARAVVLALLLRPRRVRLVLEDVTAGDGDRAAKQGPGGVRCRGRDLVDDPVELIEVQLYPVGVQAVAARLGRDDGLAHRDARLQPPAQHGDVVLQRRGDVLRGLLAPQQLSEQLLAHGAPTARRQDLQQLLRLAAGEGPRTQDIALGPDLHRSEDVDRKHSHTPGSPCDLGASAWSSPSGQVVDSDADDDAGAQLPRQETFGLSPRRRSDRHPGYSRASVRRWGFSTRETRCFTGPDRAANDAAEPGLLACR
jgi:hypothetical protein